MPKTKIGSTFTPWPGKLDDLADPWPHWQEPVGIATALAGPLGMEADQPAGDLKFGDDARDGVLVERALRGIAQNWREHRHPAHHEVDRDADGIVVKECRPDWEEDAAGHLSRLEDDVHDGEIVEERPVVCHHHQAIGAVEVRNPF